MVVIGPNIVMKQNVTLQTLDYVHLLRKCMIVTYLGKYEVESNDFKRYVVNL